MKNVTKQDIFLPQTSIFIFLSTGNPRRLVHFYVAIRYIKLDKTSLSYSIFLALTHECALFLFSFSNLTFKIHYTNQGAK